MGYEMPGRPTFLERALQGVAFWIGHRHALFRGYPLPEAAMVAETCNLVQANLSDELMLRPECSYRDMLPPNHEAEEIGGRQRADIAVLSRDARQAVKDRANVADWVQFVLEIKRQSAGKGPIDADLRRLYQFLLHTPVNPRAFLIVLSEGRAPTRFVKDGKSQLGSHDIPGSEGCFHVRRTVKAAASFSNKTSAHYVALLEVFTKRPKKLPAL